MDDLEKIQHSLDCLRHNLAQTKAAALPTVKQMTAEYQNNAELRRLIGEMRSGDSVERLCAAVLLWTVDRAAAEILLSELTRDATPLRLARTGGMGFVEGSVQAVALDFLESQNVLGANWAQTERLANLADTVSGQAANEKRILPENYLPKWSEVLAARDDFAKESELLLKIKELQTGAASEKIYAALLLKSLNQPEYQAIIESLRGDETILHFQTGDISYPFPAAALVKFLFEPPQAAGTNKTNRPVLDAVEKMFGLFDFKKKDRKL